MEFVLVCPFLRYNGNSAFTKGSKEMRKMSKSEWVETAVIFIALALLWVPILGLQQWWLRAALWVCVPVLLWIAWRRWQRFNEAVKSIQREDDIFRPLPPHLRERLK